MDMYYLNELFRDGTPASFVHNGSGGVTFSGLFVPMSEPLLVKYD